MLQRSGGEAGLGIIFPRISLKTRDEHQIHVNTSQTEMSFRTRARPVMDDSPSRFRVFCSQLQYGKRGLNPLGFFSWAAINPKSVRRLISNEGFPHFFAMWNFKNSPGLSSCLLFSEC